MKAKDSDDVAGYTPLSLPVLTMISKKTFWNDLQWVLRGDLVVNETRSCAHLSSFSDIVPQC